MKVDGHHGIVTVITREQLQKMIIKELKLEDEKIVGMKMGIVNTPNGPALDVMLLKEMETFGIEELTVVK